MLAFGVFILRIVAFLCIVSLKFGKVAFSNVVNQFLKSEKIQRYILPFASFLILSLARAPETLIIYVLSKTKIILL